MKTLLLLAIPLLLIVSPASQGETHQAPMARTVTPDSFTADRVAFYEIALTCPAAPKLGCGSRAKRVLSTLTADSRVAAAWVNEAGTRLAVGWKQPFGALTTGQLNEILVTHGLAVNPIDDEIRAELLASFRANQGWFDTLSIDELSKKESSIIAERLVRRLVKRVPVTPTQSTVLVQAIMSSCWDRGGCQVEKDVTSIARNAKLDGSGVEALREVIALGYRPLENEQ
jgi:hypothetical protein